MFYTVMFFRRVGLHSHFIHRDVCVGESML